MNRIVQLIWLIVVLLFVGCSEDNSTSPEIPEPEKFNPDDYSAEKYFPLKNEAYWDYYGCKNDNFDSRWFYTVIGPITKKNNKSYFLVKYRDESKSPFVWYSICFRISNNCVYWSDDSYDSDEEFLLYNFNKSIGETWEGYNWPETGTYIYKFAGIEEFIETCIERKYKTYNQCIKFEYTLLVNNEETKRGTIWLAPYIGIVKKFSYEFENGEIKTTYTENIHGYYIPK